MLNVVQADTLDDWDVVRCQEAQQLLDFGHFFCGYQIKWVASFKYLGLQGALIGRLLNIFGRGGLSKTYRTSVIFEADKSIPRCHD